VSRLAVVAGGGSSQSGGDPPPPNDGMTPPPEFPSSLPAPTTRLSAYGSYNHGSLVTIPDIGTDNNVLVRPDDAPIGVRRASNGTHILSIAGELQAECDGLAPGLSSISPFTLLFIGYGGLRPNRSTFGASDSSNSTDYFLLGNYNGSWNCQLRVGGSTIVNFVDNVDYNLVDHPTWCMVTWDGSEFQFRSFMQSAIRSKSTNATWAFDKSVVNGQIIGTTVSRLGRVNLCELIRLDQALSTNQQDELITWADSNYCFPVQNALPRPAGFDWISPFGVKTFDGTSIDNTVKLNDWSVLRPNPTNKVLYVDQTAALGGDGSELNPYTSLTTGLDDGTWHYIQLANGQDFSGQYGDERSRNRSLILYSPDGGDMATIANLSGTARPTYNTPGHETSFFNILINSNYSTSGSDAKADTFFLNCGIGGDLEGSGFTVFCNCSGSSNTDAISVSSDGGMVLVYGGQIQSVGPGDNHNAFTIHKGNSILCCVDFIGGKRTIHNIGSSKCWIAGCTIRDAETNGVDTGIGVLATGNNTEIWIGQNSTFSGNTVVDVQAGSTVLSGGTVNVHTSLNGVTTNATNGGTINSYT